MAALYSLQSTSWGGRGVFATQPIPKGTLVHVCESPYATVIYRKFRKEVCGQCFAYSYDSNRNSWNVKFDDQAGNGVWYCTTECRDVWAQEQNVGGLQGLMNAAVDRMAKRMKEPTDRLFAPRDLRPKDITPEALDIAWKEAENLLSKVGNVVPYLDELELDTARFLISAIIRRYFEDQTQPPAPSSDADWNSLLELQNNELIHMRSEPEMVDSHLRVYAFLRSVVVPVLRPYVATSETVRAILARDQGNVFGLWEMQDEGDSEMLGFSMYTSASYFNHDCYPNIVKKRVSRAMHFLTTRDVKIGEELCTNYIEVRDHVVDRQKELQENWYFKCACKRCEVELARAVTPVKEPAA